MTKLRKLIVKAAILSVIATAMANSPVAAKEQEMIPPPAPPALLIPPPAPSAAPATNGEVAPEHFALFDTLQELVDTDAADTMMLNNIQRGLVRDPTLASLEEISPGLIEECARGMLPTLNEHTERLLIEYRPRMAGAIARHLTPSEAVAATEFYRSRLGRKMLNLAVGGFTMDAIMENSDPNAEITQEQVGRDLNSAGMAAVRGLSPAERVELIQTITETPALRKLEGMNSDIAALRSEMENAPLSAEHERKIDRTMQSIFVRRFPNMTK